MQKVPPQIQVRLKENDVSILLGLAEGLTTDQIAQQLPNGSTGLQVTNRMHRLRIIFKARNTAHLVALSYHYGILRAPTHH